MAPKSAKARAARARAKSPGPPPLRDASESPRPPRSRGSHGSTTGPPFARSRTPPRRGSSATPTPDKRHTLTTKQGIELIKKWVWDGKAATTIQKEASDSLEDQQRLLQRLNINEDWADQDLQLLAGLGTSGKHPGNVKAELVRLLGEPDSPPADVVQVPVKTLKPTKKFQDLDDDSEPTLEEVIEIPFPILSPHKQVEHIFHSSRERFDKMFLAGGGESNLQSFWDNVERRGDPRLTDHPMRERKGWKKRAIPISVHADAVPSVGVGKAGVKSFEVTSLQGVLGNGTTIEVKLYMHGIFDSNKTDDGATDQAIWQHEARSLWWMFLGEKPDPSNPSQSSEEELCGGFSFVTWIVKRDVEHQSKGFGFRHHNSKKPCELCECTAEEGKWDTSYNNFTNRAKWKKSLHTLNTWRKGEIVHPLFQMVFMSSLNLEPDELHVQHLGVTAILLGSVLFMLCYQMLLTQLPKTC